MIRSKLPHLAAFVVFLAAPTLAGASDHSYTRADYSSAAERAVLGRFPPGEAKVMKVETAPYGDAAVLVCGAVATRGESLPFASPRQSISA